MLHESLSSHRKATVLLVLVCLTLATASAARSAEPAAEFLALHPDNPHYFQWHGKPAVLVTSGEHYGAVLNLDFDYVKYLDELQRHGLNHTRTFSGVYRESAAAFGITDNTLAPAPNRFVCPWARSDQPGYNAGGNRFDLTKWDDAYFVRLKGFLTQAARNRHRADTKTGEIDKSERLEHAGGKRTFISPRFANDVALRVVQAR